MALVKCRECGEQVAKSAKTCPHCGVKSPHRATIGAGAGCMIIIVVVIVGAMIAVSDMEPPRATPRSTTSRATRGPGQVYHARRAINVREGPATSHPIAYGLDIGDWTYIGRANSDGWAAVYGGPGTSDTVGFVYAQLLYSGRAPNLMLLDGWECGRPYGYSQVVRGVVKNTTMRAMNYVQISFNLLDAQNRQVGTAWTNTSNLAANGEWVFEAHISEDNVCSCRLAELEGS